MELCTSRAICLSLNRVARRRERLAHLDPVVLRVKMIYVTLCYASDRELKALAGKTALERTHTTGLLVASSIFFVFGAPGLVFSALYDMGLVPLIALSVVSVATGIGVLLGRRFGLWLTLLLFPLGIVEVVATLFYSVTLAGWYSNDMVAAFNASLIAYAAGLIISLLLVVDKRSQLK